MNLEEQISILKELGLSTSQAKVYLILSGPEALPAQEVSKKSGVARSDVYRVLMDLEKSGYIERIVTKPERFRSIPIENFVSNLMQSRLKKTAELQRSTLSLVKVLRSRPAQSLPEEDFHFVLVPARTAVYVKAEKMLKNVGECVCFLGLRKRMLAWLSNYSPLVEEALSRNVEFKIIMPAANNRKTDSPLKTFKKFENFHLRTIPREPNAGFSVWDKKEILLSTSEIDTPFPKPTLWSNNRSLVALAQDYFELLWKECERKSSN